MKKHAVSQLILVWTVLVSVSFAWNYYLVSNSTTDIVLNKARAFFDQIVVSRSWNAEHGGVYVPVTKTTQPNEYLKDSTRDVVTIDGIKLTKVNPAYMTRQIAEHNKSNKNLQFHITSLNPIRPQNKADEWETVALNLFEKGIAERLELIKNESSSQYRYMAPLITNENC
ncbi:MAG: DUF3365 domain-containing protein, partial [Bacteroidales bacterium]|nr:DUF3365 domain-containing protein [Bacteroidales bacterium]